MSMDDNNDVHQDSSLEEVTEEVVQEQPIEESGPSPEIDSKAIPYDRFQEKAAEVNKLKDELEALKKQPIRKVNTALEVDDYINISASLDGLDQAEKEYLSEQHKQSGKPLLDIREHENFQLWQSAYRSKVEKEQNALAPSGTQMVGDKPRSLDDKLKNASIDEKEKILADMGLYKSVRPRTDRSRIDG